MLTVGFYLARAIIDFIRNGKTAQKIQTGFFVLSLLIFWLRQIKLELENKLV